ncbi:MAG TPA: RNA 2',3'-cyclic phosphodiesterase [Candidatus Dormibacteraeota bacterium]|nr:RNA 2',3'-cyclic phosphodiesterase [Candidatus Dormibacteraeota bacterium]
MRLFVALDIPEDVRRHIADFSLELRRHAPRARWARIESAHVTLKFIGERPPGELGPLRAAIEPVRAPSPIEIEFRGAGFFRNDRQPRVLWAGVHASAALAELAADIERRLAPLGIPLESRPFAPHLTLARFNDPSESGDLRQVIAGAGLREFGRTVTREFHLYESRRAPEGSIYTRLETVVFARETP